jgi:hypothetical protein
MLKGVARPKETTMPTDPWTQGVVFGVILCLGMYAVGYIVYRWLKIWLIRRGSVFENPLAEKPKLSVFNEGQNQTKKKMHFDATQ